MRRREKNNLFSPHRKIFSPAQLDGYYPTAHCPFTPLAIAKGLEEQYV
jgi:hypothetical protein